MVVLVQSDRTSRNVKLKLISFIFVYYSKTRQRNHNFKPNF